MQLAPDGTLVHAGGRDGIRFDLPVSEQARGSSIQAKTFDANGTAGAGLTSATFVDDVQFREDVPKGTPRIARSRTLDLSLEQDEVSAATFKGSVAFEDRGLAACAAQVRYSPKGGTIALSGADAGGGPRASDDRVAIAAEAIDVTLQGTQIEARGGVKTVLRPPRDARGGCLPRGPASAGETARGGDENKLPKLLKDDAPVNVNADRLSYAGAGGAATYVGNATLWQGSETSIRADELRLDQSKGDLTASGAARSTLMLAGTPSVGRADEIRYEDAKRVIVYESRRPAPLARGRPAGGGTGHTRGACGAGTRTGGAARARPRSGARARAGDRAGWHPWGAVAGADAGLCVGPAGRTARLAHRDGADA